MFHSKEGHRHFTGDEAGRTPYGVLIRDAAGNLYGTTQFGGTGSGGVLFKIELN